MLGKLASRPQKRRAILERGIHESEAFPFQIRIWDRLAVQIDQLRFVIPKLQLGWASRHEEVNDVLGARRMMALFGREWIRRTGSLRPEGVPPAHQGSESDAAEAHGAAAEKVPTGHVLLEEAL